jgi:hypothetical protein
MELGNMMFGNSRGSYPIERGNGWEQEIFRLVEAYSPLSDDDRDPPEFENDVFSVFPYYWVDCNCGFDERDAEWSEAHRHAAGCYQSRVYTETKAYNEKIGYKSPSSFMDMFYTDSEPVVIEGHTVGTAMTMTPRRDDRELAKLSSDFEDKTRQRLCAELKLSYPQGCAVHCTCGYDDEYQKWRKTNDHTAACLLVKPNFLYKPMGFEIQWYKYPLRDSYKNMNVGLGDFRKIIDICVGSTQRESGCRIAVEESHGAFSCLNKKMIGLT